MSDKIESVVSLLNALIFDYKSTQLEAELIEVRATIQQLQDRIKQLEAEKPVTCGECERFHRHTEVDKERGGCYPKGNILSVRTVHENDFCSYGKRKEKA